jgi:hypothetical protein
LLSSAFPDSGSSPAEHFLTSRPTSTMLSNESVVQFPHPAVVEANNRFRKCPVYSSLTTRSNNETKNVNFELQRNKFCDNLCCKVIQGCFTHSRH